MILYEFWEKCIVGQGGSVNPPSWHTNEDGYIYRSGLDVEVNLVTLRGWGVGWVATRPYQTDSTPTRSN